jgi:agmatine/peptidylarginine deiminase
MILSVVATWSCSGKLNKSIDLSEANFYTQRDHNRVAAEWEPALGTMITWPLCIPHKLVIELAKDNHLYTLVANKTSKKEALEWYTKWGIDSTKNTFVFAPQGIDSWWVRDWGPSAVFKVGGKMKLGDGKYVYSTPYTGIQCGDSLGFIYKMKDNTIIKTETEDSETLYLGQALNIELLDLPFVNTGGNVQTDGLGTAFSTCVLLNENRFFGVPQEKFFDLNKNLLGLDRYHIISNFETRGIQHIDCFMKLLDEERILVAEPPKDHYLYNTYENIVKNELSKLISPYGRPYQILRVKTSRFRKEALAAYTNSLILNKTVYVPLYKIKEDSIALQTWREVMPGYTIKGFEFDLVDEPFTTQQMKDHYQTYGWVGDDGLHCRTRAVWDSAMLFITTKRIEPEVNSNHANIVCTTIIDYSKIGLVKEKCNLFWKMAGETDWNKIVLNQVEGTDHFFAEIPLHKSGTTIEYYVSATSNSGRMETQPRTAPLGTYKFAIK